MTKTHMKQIGNKIKYLNGTRQAGRKIKTFLNKYTNRMEYRLEKNRRNLTGEKLFKTYTKSNIFLFDIILIIGK